jgi:hypothetical protein
VIAVLLTACAHAVDGGAPDETDASSDRGASDAVANPPKDSGTTTNDATSPADAGGDTQVASEASVVDVSVVDVVQQQQHIVFVSSATYNGNLGGLSGADSKCQSLATAANLKGTFKAWLSDSTTSAASRLTHATAPYLLVDSTIVANDWNGLTSGNLLHAIDLDESGQTPAAGTYGCTSDPSVWSHTGTNGLLLTGGDCSDWTSTTATTTHAGTSDAKSWAWTDACQIGGSGVCAKTASLYCIQQ